MKTATWAPACNLAVKQADTKNGDLPWLKLRRGQTGESGKAPLLLSYEASDLTKYYRTSEEMTIRRQSFVSLVEEGLFQQILRNKKGCRNRADSHSLE